MMFGRISRNNQGSILLVCFFVLILLSMFVLTVGYRVRQRIQVITRVDTRQKLRLLADSAAKKSIYILLKHRKSNEPFDALNQTWSQNEAEFKEIKIGDGSFSVVHSVESYDSKTHDTETVPRYGLIDEESKININAVKSLDILIKLFSEVASMSLRDADALARAMESWKSKNSSALGFGDGDYEDLKPPYKPRHGDFVALHELQWVKGMTPEIYKKILPYITLFSSGQVNLNTAPRPVLLALGIMPSVCEKIIVYRNWHDGIEATSDDRFFENLATVTQVLANSSYLDDNEISNLMGIIQSGILSVKSQNFSAEVLAQLPHKNQVLRLKVVFDERGVVKQWEEEFATISSLSF